MKKTALVSAALLALPFVVSAQGNLSNIGTLVGSFGTIANMAIPIMITVALLFFFWGLITYVRGAGEDKGEGKKIMLGGIAALFIMVSIWGIVGFAQSALGINNVQTVTSPRVQ